MLKCLHKNLFFFYLSHLTVYCHAGHYSSRVGTLSCSAQCTRVLYCDWLSHVMCVFIYLRGRFLVCGGLILCCSVSSCVSHNKLGNINQKLCLFFGTKLSHALSSVDRDKDQFYNSTL